MIVYSKSTSNLGAIGKLETPIKMVIERESDLLTKKGGVCDWLFNVEKSSRFGETIITETDFDIFMSADEGSGAEIDSIEETGRKFIEHIQFLKEFVITAEMMEDAGYGIAPDAKRRIETFTRAYYKTRNKLCETALAQANSPYCNFARTTVDLTTADGLSLFNSNHKYGTGGNTQSNYYYGDIFKTKIDSERKYSTEVFEESLSNLSVKLRNMKDENGEAMGYVADTIILPANRPAAEMITKKTCGSEGALGNGYNDINLHYGNWNIVILPSWQTSDDRMIIMSSEANKNLGGNMFFNRVPLTVTNWVDNHTGNYVWNGRCRFGVGFGTYKHAILAVDSDTKVGNHSTKLQ